MKFIAKFKFLLSFLIAMIAALSPSIYNEYKLNKHKTSIYFTYESFEDIGLKILAGKYPHLGSFATLKEKYIAMVDKKFNEKKYTLRSVKTDAKANIPISEALSMLQDIHGPTIETIGRPFISKFTLFNKSSDTLSINKLVISTDDAYSNPVWDVYFDFPCEKCCNLKRVLSNSYGYVLEFDKKMVLPRQTKFQLYIFFPDMPIIKQEHSFSQIQVDDKSDTIIHLHKEIKVDKLNIYLEFALRIIIIFFVILGLAYLSLLVVTSLKNNKGSIPTKG